MKSLKFIPVIVAIFGITLVGCTKSESESKIAKLEGRIAELEGGDIAKKRASSTTTPAAKAPEVKPEGPLPEFSFETEDHDFGKIEEGEQVEHIFSFTNTGDAPLIISAAKGSCGCTVPEWPKEPIAVGETGEIKVKFNSKKKPGIQNKTVTITSNTFPTQKKIRIKADVNPAPAE